MSTTRFKMSSLRDKQEVKDNVADPRLDELVEKVAEPKKKKAAKKK